MTIDIKNLFADLPETSVNECLQTILKNKNIRIERIISFGQSTADGEWYDQDETEWVVLLQGGAGILFEGEEQAHILKAGDYLLIPPHCRHRVEWTKEGENTIWLALFFE